MELETFVNISAVPENLRDEVLQNYNNKTLSSPLYIIIVYSILVFGSVVITTLSRLIFFKIAMNASINLHTTMFDNILQATMRFFDTNASGKL